MTHIVIQSLSNLLFDLLTAFENVLSPRRLHACVTCIELPFNVSTMKLPVFGIPFYFQLSTCWSRFYLLSLRISEIGQIPYAITTKLTINH